MRLLHTSDWHLGHTLKDVSREHEHRAFLAWLLEACAREAPDALVITGDVFDSATPPASAETMWFSFLAAARRARPAMDIVAIAGNHDSPARLGAASSVLRELDVHVVGGLPRTASGALDLDRILIPVAGGRGLVVAVPFVRPFDIAPGDDDDPLASIYKDVLDAARARRAPGQALIALGHLYVAGADAAMLSERRVSIGGQESASARMFPSDIDYVALGHIHRAQRIGRNTMRYAGAPIPLALEEASYKHSIAAVDFSDLDDARAGGDLRVEVRLLPIPRSVEILRVPRRGAAPLVDVLGEIAEMPARSSLGDDDASRPYLEVVVALDRPEPRLRTTIEAAMDGKAPRLIALHVEATGDRAALADAVAQRRLAELDPRDVFLRLWARDHVEPPSEAIVAAFERLVAEVRGDVSDLEAS